jgi:PAS domain S-box-containing protein
VATRTTNYLTGDAAFAVDRRGVIVSWNPAAEELLGYSKAGAVGRHCWQLLSGKDLFGNRYCCERCPVREMALQHESVHGFEAFLNTASGGQKKFAINCIQVFGNNGDERLLHICRALDEAAEHPHEHDAAGRPSANFHRGALTTREHEVLNLLAEGKTTAEIASMMCISEATVRNHIQHTLYKLHVHNRLEAVVKGQQLDLV